LHRIGSQEKVFGAPGLTPHTRRIMPILAVNTNCHIPAQGNGHGWCHNPGPAPQDRPTRPESPALPDLQPRLGCEDPSTLASASEPAAGENGLFGITFVPIRPTYWAAVDVRHRAVDPRIYRELTVIPRHWRS
jgi:hypothetical protein